MKQHAGWSSMPGGRHTYFSSVLRAGNKMARRLIQQGFSMTAWNRSAEKAQPLAEAGASVASTAADVVKGSDVILLMLADCAAIRCVCAGAVDSCAVGHHTTCMVCQRSMDGAAPFVAPCRMQAVPAPACAKQ